MMKQRSRKGTRSGRKPQNGRSISHPPQINGIQLKHSMTLRFITNAAVSQNITFQNLLDTMLVATSTTAVYDVFQTVKVRRVRVWALPIIGAASAVSVEFSGLTTGITGDQVIHTDTSMGIQPAHVDARPSRRALASDYQVSTNAVAFALICPTGSVVDVELSFNGQYGPTATAATACVGATTGAFYLRGMDGLPLATTKFVPEYPVYV